MTGSFLRLTSSNSASNSARVDHSLKNCPSKTKEAKPYMTGFAFY